MLRRETQKTIPPRILSLTSDGSIKLLSPVSGSCIITAFPIHKDDAVTDAAYDMTAGK